MSNRLPVLAIEIRRAHADVGEAAKTAAERAIAAGRALMEAKGLLGHGKWLPWLRDNCALAERSAQLYIRVAKSGVKPATLADLGLQAAANRRASCRNSRTSKHWNAIKNKLATRLYFHREMMYDYENLHGHKSEHINDTSTT